MKATYSLMLSAVFAAMMSACSQQQAQQTQAEETNPAVLTLQDGKTRVEWLKDNPGQKLMDRSLFPQASDSLMEELNLTDGVPSSISTFVMKADDEWILFDAGLGVANGGQMLESMKQIGLTPDSIKYVYITHFHGDHIGGMLTPEQKPVFANAEVYAGRLEYDAWVKQMPEDKNGLQRMVMEAYQDKLHLFEFGDKLPHDVLAIDAVGHTPGHTAFQKEDLLVIGDLMHGAALQMAHPEISGNYDMDKVKAAESRQRIINYAKENNLTMAGMHLPEPAFMTIKL